MKLKVLLQNLGLILVFLGLSPVQALSFLGWSGAGIEGL